MIRPRVHATIDCVIVIIIMLLAGCSSRLITEQTRENYDLLGQIHEHFEGQDTQRMFMLAEEEINEWRIRGLSFYVDRGVPRFFFQLVTPGHTANVQVSITKLGRIRNTRVTNIQQRNRT